MKNLLAIVLLFMNIFATAQVIDLGSTSTRAVVVGISDYQDKDIPDLRFADRDAEAFANYLRSPAGGSLDGDHLKLLTNKDATTAQFDAALGWLMDESKEGDQAIIYFSGHGDVETKTRSQQGFLLCWDSPPQAYVSGAYPIFFLKEVVSTLSMENKSRVIVITDACRSGKLAGNTIGGSQLTSQNLAQQFANEIKILSCQPNEYSIEGEQWGGGRGAFSFHLVDGLYGMADGNADASVNLMEIGRYLDDHVTSEVAPQSQVPMTVGNRTEKLATVFPDMLAQVKKNKAGQLPIFSPTDSRGIEEDVLATVDTTIRELYRLFKKALKDKVFLEPSGACADAYYERLIAEPKMERLHNAMRRNYAAALQDDAQQVMNGWLKSDGTKKSVSKKVLADQFRPYPHYLNRAASLLGEQHYMFPILQARKLFFEGYLLIQYDNKRDIERGKKALGLFREALRFQPDLPQAWWQMSKAFAYNLEQVDSAEYCARRAMEMLPNWAIPASDIAYFLNSRFRMIEESLPYIEYVVRLDSTSFYAFSSRAAYHFAKREWNNAAEVYKKGIEYHSDDILLYSNLGLALFYADRNEEALQVMLKAIEIDPTYDFLYINLGACYAYLGQAGKAESYGKKAIELDPASGVNHYGFACILAIIGQPKHAFEVLEKSLTMGDETYDYDWLQFDPDLANIRALPEWKELMKKYFPDQAKD
ncbi:MAG: tetratricopeptide repeat protein [Saprospiraceae bacterium]|nr:tetratricopeptide repeat protein [Saprospiraceae bacterium]